MSTAPRMTPAEADARFAALVAEHRGAGGRRRVPSRPERDATLATLVVVIVFCLGVACGALMPGKPLLAILLGVPAILLGGRWLRRRRSGRDD